MTESEHVLSSPTYGVVVADTIRELLANIASCAALGRYRRGVFECCQGPA